MNFQQAIGLRCNNSFDLEKRKELCFSREEKNERIFFREEKGKEPTWRPDPGVQPIQGNAYRALLSRPTVKYKSSFRGTQQEAKTEQEPRAFASGCRRSSPEQEP